MTNWQLTIDLSHIWRDQTLPFEEKRDAIIKVLKGSGWLNLTEDHGYLKSTIDQLGWATTIYEFDAGFGVIYDIADIDHVWIDTI